MIITDKDRIDFLQDLLVKDGSYTKKCILRRSRDGRGYRLHETSKDGAGEDIRVEIDKVLIKLRKPMADIPEPPKPPIPPPNRRFKSYPFIGDIETQESKQATLDWYLNKGNVDPFPQPAFPMNYICPSPFMTFWYNVTSIFKKEKKY